MYIEHALGRMYLDSHVYAGILGVLPFVRLLHVGYLLVGPPRRGLLRGGLTLSPYFIPYKLYPYLFSPYSIPLSCLIQPLRRGIN